MLRIRNACAKYKKELEKAKAAERNKLATQQTANPSNQDASRREVMEASELKTVQNAENSVSKELVLSQKCVDEATLKVGDAIKRKDFASATVAQVLLESAQKRLRETTEKVQENNKKRKLMDSVTSLCSKKKKN